MAHFQHCVFFHVAVLPYQMLQLFTCFIFYFLFLTLLCLNKKNSLRHSYLPYRYYLLYIRYLARNHVDMPWPATRSPSKSFTTSSIWLPYDTKTFLYWKKRSRNHKECCQVIGIQTQLYSVLLCHGFNSKIKINQIAFTLYYWIQRQCQPPPDSPWE